MKERKYFCLSIVMLFLVQASVVASEDENIQTTALLFKSDPTIVTVVSGGSDGKGHIIGTQVGGVVTSQFPDSIVLLNSKAPINSIKTRSRRSSNVISSFNAEASLFKGSRPFGSNKTPSPAGAEHFQRPSAIVCLRTRSILASIVCLSGRTPGFLKRDSQSVHLPAHIPLINKRSCWMRSSDSARPNRF